LKSAPEFLIAPTFGEIIEVFEDQRVFHLRFGNANFLFLMIESNNCHGGALLRR
jgi:hypothetical protein